MENVYVTKVQSCQQAAERLLIDLPDWILVDFIVPQKMWGDGLLYRVPGLKFIETVNSEYKGKVRIAAYGRGVSQQWKTVAETNGAMHVFEKRGIAFTDVLRRLKAGQEV